jgi:hypothetical protein
MPEYRQRLRTCQPTWLLNGGSSLRAAVALRSRRRADVRRLRSHARCAARELTRAGHRAGIGQLLPLAHRTEPPFGRRLYPVSCPCALDDAPAEAGRLRRAGMGRVQVRERVDRTSGRGHCAGCDLQRSCRCRKGRYLVSIFSSGGDGQRFLEGRGASCCDRAGRWPSMYERRQTLTGRRPRSSRQSRRVQLLAHTVQRR